MRRLALLLLLAIPALGQTDLEKCQTRACYGFGPPSGASQNGLIFQDLSVSPPKLYCGYSGGWALCGTTGGTGSLINLAVSGTIDGSNTVFTLASAPASELLFMLNGQKLRAGVGYTLVGTTVTMTTAPQVGDVLEAISTQNAISGVVNALNGVTGAAFLTGPAVSQVGNTFTFTGGGCNPSGSDNSLLYKNAANCPGSQVSVDLPVDASGGSIKIPKMNNTISSDIGQGGNPYWTTSTVFPQQMPGVTKYQGNYQFSNNDFYAAHAKSIKVFGTNRYTLASAGESGPDMAIQYDLMSMYSPDQIGGGYNLHIDNLAHGDTVGHTDNVTARGVTEGFEEGLEPDRRFYAYAFYSPHGVLTLGASDYMHHKYVTVNALNIAGTFAEDNTILNETKKFVPAGNITATYHPSTLLGAHYAALDMDAAAKASLDAKYGTTLHNAAIVSGAEDNVKYNGSCPSTSVGTWSPIVPFNPTDATGNGMLTQNQCVTVSGDISSLTTGSVVSIWGDHANTETAYVVSKPDSTHLVLSLNHPHDPGEVLTWGAGVGNDASVPRSYVPRLLLSSGAAFQEEDAIFSMPVVGWDSANSQIILWPSYAAQGSPEVKIAAYTTNTPLIGMTVTGTVVANAFTTLTVTPGSNYQTSTGASGTVSFLPPPNLSFNCSVAPTYSWAADTTVNVPAYTITLLTGGSGCTNNTVTVQNTYSNPVWIYPSLRIWHAQNIIDGGTSGLVNGHNMLVYAIPNPGDFVNGDSLRQSTMTTQYTTGNQQTSGSPAVEYSARNGPTGTFQYNFPQSTSSTASVHYTTNSTDGKYYWSDAAHFWAPSQDVSANPLLGVGRLSFADGLGGSWGGWFHMTSPPYAKSTAGKVAGGTLIQVDCTHPGQDQEGAHTPCNDRNIYPKFRFLANLGLTNFNYIDVDANTGIVDVGPQMTIGMKTVCKTDPVTHLAYADCPTLRDFTMVLATPPFAPTPGHIYQIGSLLAPIDSNNPLVNTFYVPADCNAKGIDYTETAVTGAPPSSEGVQLTVFQNGVTPISAPLSTPWNATGVNHLHASANFALTAGDRITFQIFTPSWGTAPSGTIAATASVYCSVP